ncbi:hypothetical protein [Paenibacillus cremeus]|uniref:hypothetical protein n=1 Tax=Paenibacillus cremeus TaxID=2163881 RepID=UPI001645FB6B|nr:hypothetical protein [Paenibacillus cremeus]
MEIYFIIIGVALIERYLPKLICTEVHVPICRACGEFDTLALRETGYYCNHCSAELPLVYVAKYEQDVRILQENPEIYTTFKESRQSFIHLGYGKMMQEGKEYASGYRKIGRAKDSGGDCH